MMNSQSRNRGFSLIEVLVTIVLISIGVLGMVAMQAKTISYTQDSVQRNAAAMLADDLMEIIRTNSAIASSYYKAAGTDFPAKPETCYPLPASASERLGCWAARAKDALPDAAALAEDEFVIAKTGDALSIKLAWRVKEGECFEADAADATVCHYTLTAEL